MSARPAIGAALLACILAAAASVSASERQAAQRDAAGAPGCPAALAGEYQLAGVMETGSGLRLQADCGFEWYFSYGALDLAARGRWQAGADGLSLQVQDMALPPQLPQYRFEHMRLRRDGTDLVPSWPWDMDALAKDRERGRYQRVQP